MDLFAIDIASDRRVVGVWHSCGVLLRGDLARGGMVIVPTGAQENAWT